MKKLLTKGKCKPFLLSFIVLIGATFTSLNILAASITFGANESPPYWSKNLDMNGMCGEIVYAISKAAGIESKIEFLPLKRLIGDDSNNDLGNPIFYMENQEFAAIIPIAIYDVNFIYYQPHFKKNIVINNFNDLKGYEIGFLKGTMADHSHFKRDGIAFQTSYSQDSLFKKMKLGRIDLSLEIGLVAQTSIKKIFPNEIHNFKFIPIKNSDSPIAIMISEDYPNAKSIGDKLRFGLSKIIKNGQYNKILEKYYGKGKVPHQWHKRLDEFRQLYYF